LGVFLALNVNTNKIPNNSGVIDQEDQSLKDAVLEAFGSNSYLLLNLGFFVCGFHIAFITTHLPMF